jgi:RNA polymerase sigma factor (sigma-70 family)
MFGIGKLADEIIIERIKQGDEKILVHLYKEHHTMVKKFILKNNGDDSAVDDILQDTVIAVWKNANKSEFLLQAKLSTYVMAIGKNLWFKELKKRAKFKLVDEANHLEHGSVEITLNIDQNIIRQLVKDMDKTCSQLLAYFYFDGLSTKVIAEKLGYANADTVKSKKYQCFKKLQGTVLATYNKEELL